MLPKLQLIRNFCIIAHIDHGKSTLSDRLIERAINTNPHKMKNQILDSMDLERERGITIKLNAVQLIYHEKQKNVNYFFHLIDTPGHVDFTYEVSRSLAACEGALLIVDATQGVQAQTISNLYLAIANNLTIIPVINKIDLKNADVEETKKQLQTILGFDPKKIICISAKTGQNIDQLINAIITQIPYPKNNDKNLKLQALIFDSYYDKYLGAVCYFRIKNGTIKLGQKIKMMASNKSFIVSSLGVKTPEFISKNELVAGEVGWLAANIKSIKDISIGDTITNFLQPATSPLPGYKKIQPMVFCSFYPVDNTKYNELKIAMEKINLSDSSLVYEYETSQSLGFGIRCGFLGLLHLDVIKERIAREYGLNLIVTPPSVKIRIDLTNGKTIEINNPLNFPNPTTIAKINEPCVKLSIFTPDQFLGDLLKLCQNNRGKYIDLIAIEHNRKEIIYEMPLIEIIYSFFDQLKSISKGYATMEYE